MYGCLNAWISWCVSYFDPIQQEAEYGRYMNSAYIEPKQQKLVSLTSEYNIAEQDLRQAKERIYKNLLKRGITEFRKVKLSPYDSMALNEKIQNVNALRSEIRHISNSLKYMKSVVNLNPQIADYNEKKALDKLLTLKEKAGIDITKIRKLDEKIMNATSRLTEQQQLDIESRGELQLMSMVQEEQMQELADQTSELTEMNHTEFDFSEFTKEEEAVQSYNHVSSMNAENTDLPLLHSEGLI